MKKPLTVLPNFTILADANDPNYLDIIGCLRCFCYIESYAEHIDTYKITPKSFWYGMNATNRDFIQFLKEHSESLDGNVLKELEKFQAKFGQIILLGETKLQIHSKDILDQIKSNTKLKEMIQAIENTEVTLNEININELQNILVEEIGYPFQLQRVEVNQISPLIQKLERNAEAWEKKNFHVSQ